MKERGRWKKRARHGSLSKCQKEMIAGKKRGLSTKMMHEKPAENSKRSKKYLMEAQTIVSVLS